MSARTIASDIFFSKLAVITGDMERPVQITRLPRDEFYRSIYEIDKRQTRVPPQISLSRLSKRLSERLITSKSVSSPDCISCGACCVYGLIAIDRRDPEPLTEYIELTLDNADVVIERVLPREKEDGRCTHLKGTIGVEISCEIYPDRPRICRDFEAGSDRCFGYRRMFGIDPPLGDDELTGALQKLEDYEQPLKVLAIDIKLESKTLTFDREGTAVAEELSLKVVAHLSDGATMEIHSYNPENEGWYEHELEGLTLDKAIEKIEQARVV
ncbi:MAG: YkgJ family cysteine cluster protein [Pyrinomonadaceae bacterium]